MLGNRYRNDGKALIKLSPHQIEAKGQVNSKIKQGIYQFEAVPCCICNSQDFQTLSYKDRYGLYMPVVICQECGLVQTNPRMTEESYREFYNHEYRLLYEAELAGETLFQHQYHKGRRIFDYLYQHKVLPRSAGLFVFEVGCATGGIIQYFKDKGCLVRGIDLDETAVNFGRGKGLDLSTGTINDVQFDRLPDIVIYADVLEHICDPEKELALIREILPPDGILYVEMPGVKNLLDSWRDFLGILQNAHTYHFTITTLANLMQANGFQLVTGCERVAATFKKAPVMEPKIPTNDYEAVMTYLRRWEYLRLVFPFSQGELRQVPLIYAAKVLKRLGLYGLAHKAYTSLRS